MARPEVERAIRTLARRMKGRPTPEAVVEAARPETSPLHPYITWDIEKAARGYQIEEARSLIASVKIEVKTTKYSIMVPAYIRDPHLSGHEQGYVSLRDLISDEQASRDAIVNEFSRAATHVSRAKGIAMALGLGDEIVEVQERIMALIERAETLPVPKGSEPDASPAVRKRRPPSGGEARSG